MQTASAERSSVVNSAQMDDLMINGRTALSVVALMPGVVANGANYNISGLRLGQVNITADGINIVEAGSEYQTNTTVGMDAVSEIKVLSSNYQTAARCTAITRSKPDSFSSVCGRERFDGRLQSVSGGQRPPRSHHTVVARRVWNYGLAGAQTNATFGQVTAAASPRIMQLALRFLF